MQTSFLGNLLGCFTVKQRGSVYSRGSTYQIGTSATRTSTDPAMRILLGSLRTETTRLRQGGRNALRAINMVQKADEALDQISSVLAESLALAQQAGGGGYTQSKQAPMEAEFAGLLDRLDVIGASADFGGTNLLTAVGAVVVSLAETNEDQATEVRIRTEDVSAEGLGLTGVGSDLTYATLTAASIYGVDNPDDPYIVGPQTGAPTELTFTCHGPAGDKVVTIGLKKSKSLTDIVDLINSEMNSLSPGWSGAEAVQVDGKWVLKVTTYGPGQADAPDVSVDGALDWINNDPVLPSHFTGQAGSAGSSGALVLTASDAVEKIESAIEDVAALRSDFATSILRLTIAGSALESAVGYSLEAEMRINDQDTARETAASTRGEILGRAPMALLLQANVTPEATLLLLDLPPVEERGITFVLWA